MSWSDDGWSRACGELARNNVMVVLCALNLGPISCDMIRYDTRCDMVYDTVCGILRCHAMVLYSGV